MFQISETCACPEFFKVNWYSEEPYEQMFTRIVQMFVNEMCSPCVNSYGPTTLCNYDSCGGTPRHRKRSNRKNSPGELTSDIGTNFEVSYPVQGNKYVTSYAGVFPYISVVDAPGSAYFTVKNVPSTADVVVNTSIGCIPVIFLMLLFAYIAGIIIWYLVSYLLNF